ncbi:MAG: WG repeat-containing protein [bacterium]|nr:WG repeat-containing protein [bacterium]
MKFHRPIFTALVLSLLFFFSSASMRCANIEKGFDALSVFNYFEARQVFSACNRKAINPYAAFGLATIYRRHDNPFYNLDSAVKYVNLSYNSYRLQPKPVRYGNYVIDSTSILQTADSISFSCSEIAKKQNTVAACNYFLRSNYLGRKKFIYKVVYLRDELEFDRVMENASSDSTSQFILTHPQSTFLMEAKTLMDRQIYTETTFPNTDSVYIYFLKRYPTNIMRNTAYDRLFSIYRDQKDIKGLGGFVEKYPKAPQAIEAWKLLFSLSVKVYTYSELKNFLEVYPKFPLKNSILRELELNKLVLYSCQRGDFTGFIDAKGKFVIRPQYEDATEFSEGLAVVTRGDSVFFINKENTNPFQKIYADASVFRNGIAPVKIDKKWCFINRQGQIISNFYDEIRELSGSIYVVKAGERFGALDQFGQLVLEPTFEKLGDFHNDYAYYSANGNYGFVSRTGFVHKPDFEWISVFDAEQIAVIKKNGKYGLIRADGKIVLEPSYDQILKAQGTIFILVSDNLYGFYNSEGCFMTPVAYEFMKEKGADFYTNGKVLKLQKKGEQALVDLNGRFHVNYGVYESVSFAGNGLLMVKRKGRCGYVDTRLNPVIAYKYQEASDFEDSLAIVILNDKKTLIDLQGNELYSGDHDLKKISKHYYFVENEEGSILNSSGKFECQGIERFKLHQKGMLIVTLLNGEIKLLYD